MTGSGTGTSDRGRWGRVRWSAPNALAMLGGGLAAGAAVSLLATALTHCSQVVAEECGCAGLPGETPARTKRGAARRTPSARRSCRRKGCYKRMRCMTLLQKNTLYDFFTKPTVASSEYIQKQLCDLHARELASDTTVIPAVSWSPIKKPIPLASEQCVCAMRNCERDAAASSAIFS